VNIRSALKSQLHASLAMLRIVVENCPDALWDDGEHPRKFWRIAYHATYYGHLYLMQTLEDFEPWPKYQADHQRIYGEVAEFPACSKGDVLEYIEYVDGMVDRQIDALDLESQESGFSWYTMPKLDHVMVNIRHVQEHAGQLGERLLQAGADISWVGKA